MNNTSNPTKKTDRELVERYLAPPPSGKGRIYAVDQHPDINVTAVITGTTPHDMKILETKGEQTMPELVTWLAEHATSEDIILVEASTGSFELVRRLNAHKLNCCILESSWIGLQADKYVDNDKMAAIRIARVYLQGNAKAVWVPDQKTIESRQLLHIHNTAIADRTKSINRLRGYLTQYNVRPGRKTLSNAKHQEWMRKQRDWTQAESFLLEDLMEQVNYHTERCKKVDQLIASEIAQNPVMLSLMSLLGIGVINAFALVAVIGDINRFNNPKKLAAYIGLNPSQKKSGKGKNKKIGVGVSGRKDMRALITQSAQAVLNRGSQTSLGKWGMSLMLRKGNRNIAVSAIARRMAMQVWHLLKGNKPELLESSTSRDVKFRKLLALIGRDGRQKIGLPNKSIDSIMQFNKMISQEITT